MPCVSVSPVFTLVLEWAPRRGVRLLHYLDDWVHSRVEDPSALASRSGSPVVQESGDRCQLLEVRPPAVHSCPVSGVEGKHISQVGVPVRSLSGSLSGSGDFFFSYFRPPHPARMWQQALGHMASLESFLP